MIQSRRSLLRGLGASLIVAPAVVRAASLMPIRGIIVPTLDEMYATAHAGINTNLYGDLAAVTRKAFVPRLFVQLYQQPPLYALPREFWDGE